jgi:hypothetical protein
MELYNRTFVDTIDNFLGRRWRVERPIAIAPADALTTMFCGLGVLWFQGRRSESERDIQKFKLCGHAGFSKGHLVNMEMTRSQIFRRDECT